MKHTDSEPIELSEEDLFPLACRFFGAAIFVTVFAAVAFTWASSAFPSLFAL